MNVTVSKIKTAYNNKSQDQKDAEKKVVTGGGALAGTAKAVSNANKVKNGIIPTAGSVDKFSKGMTAINETSKASTTVIKKATTLWGKICEGTKWAKNSIIEWGAKIKAHRFIKPILTSSVFKFVAGAIGVGFGIITLISGLGEIAKATAQPLEDSGLFKKDEN